MEKFKKIYVEITNKCNKSCSFCSTDDRGNSEISLANFEHILKEIRPSTNYLYLHVKGEPLLHSHFKEILDLCSKYEFVTNITTNGSLLFLNKDIISANKSIRQINISLNSIETIKDVLSIEKIIEAVNYINVISKVTFVYRFWAISDDKLSPINKRIMDILSSHYHFNQESLKNENNIEIGNNIYLNKAELFTWPNINNEFVGDDGFCYGLKSHVGILADGTIVPCCLDSKGIINLGNIYKENFKDVINGDRAKAIYKGFKNNQVTEELCKHCSYRLRFRKSKKSKNML